MAPIGFVQHTKPEVINTRRKLAQSEWILMEWLPSVKSVTPSMDYGVISKPTAELRFYLASGGFVQGYFHVVAIKGGVVPTLVLENWIELKPRPLDMFRGYMPYNHETMSPYAITKSGNTYHYDHLLGVIKEGKFKMWFGKNSMCITASHIGISAFLLKMLKERGIEEVEIIHYASPPKKYDLKITDWESKYATVDFVYDELHTFAPLRHSKLRADLKEK